MPSGLYHRQGYRRPPRSKSGLKGVIYVPSHAGTSPWKAYLRNKGQYVTIGYFKSKGEASRAYLRRALDVYGVDAYLNPVLFDARIPGD